MRERGVDLEEINSSYLVIPPRAANLILYVLAVVRPPRFLFDWMLRFARASSEEQKLYPRLGMVLRTAYLTKRALNHLRRMDFSITPGWTGYVLWRLGVIKLWRARFTPRLAKPAPKPPRGPLLQVVGPGAGAGEDAAAA